MIKGETAEAYTVYSNHICDYILDSGANCTYFNNTKNLHNIRKYSDTLYMGDNSCIDITNIGTFGVLKHVLVAPDLHMSLISSKTLTIDNDFLILFDRERAFIIERELLKNKSFQEAIVATATLKSDNLYHIDNIECFLRWSNVKHKAYLTQSESVKGSARILKRATTHNMNPLEILHVKLGHVNEDLIKWIVKNNIIIGLNVKYNDIKDLHLQLCDACMKGKMKAFPIPPSITYKAYQIFEHIACDIIDFNRKSCRGYRYLFLFIEKATTKTFPKFS